MLHEPNKIHSFDLWMYYIYVERNSIVVFCKRLFVLDEIYILLHF